MINQQFVPFVMPQSCWIMVSSDFSFTPNNWLSQWDTCLTMSTSINTFHSFRCSGFDEVHCSCPALHRSIVSHCCWLVIMVWCHSVWPTERRGFFQGSHRTDKLTISGWEISLKFSVRNDSGMTFFFLKPACLWFSQLYSTFKEILTSQRRQKSIWRDAMEADGGRDF